MRRVFLVTGLLAASNAALADPIDERTVPSPFRSGLVMSNGVPTEMKRDLCYDWAATAAKIMRDRQAGVGSHDVVKRYGDRYSDLVTVAFSTPERDTIDDQGDITAKFSLDTMLACQTAKEVKFPGMATSHLRPNE